MFNILYAMGVYFEVQVLRSSTEIAYATFDEALSRYATRYDTATQAQRDLLAEHLRAQMMHRRKAFILPRQEVGMRIPWNV